MKRICTYLLSIGLILCAVLPGSAETDADLYDKYDQFWAEYRDKDYHYQEYERL